ncbi:peptidase [Streptomyces sp. NPDC050433]|uniref:peptidase n=1 Tax=Streptomyces sp. NPDC050433 TaxID=3365615 RepID=UPI00378C198A
MPDDHAFPTITQYASPDLIAAFAYEGRTHGADPRWAESGAPDLDTYGRWCGHMCGIACLRMALLARTGNAPTLFELLGGARKYGAYTENLDTGTIHGLIYAPFAQYVQDTHPLKAQVHPTLTVPDLLTLLDNGHLVMASVHKEIRRPENPAPGKGGHPRPHHQPPRRHRAPPQPLRPHRPSPHRDNTPTLASRLPGSGHFAHVDFHIWS